MTRRPGTGRSALGLTARRGRLTTCFDSLTGKDGAVRMEWLWLWLPADSLRERRIVGVVSEMTEAQALEIAGQL